MMLVTGLASFMVSEFLLCFTFLELCQFKRCVIVSSSLLGIYIFVRCSLIS